MYIINYEYTVNIYGISPKLKKKRKNTELTILFGMNWAFAVRNVNREIQGYRNQKAAIPGT